jgi:hypothetical protein
VANAVWHDVILATQAVVRGLGLTHSGGTLLPDSQVYARKRASDLNAVVPFVMVAKGGDEVLTEGSFEHYEWHLPVLVVHAFPTNPSYELNADEFAWRQAIAEAFLDRPRPEVETGRVFDCDVDTAPALDLSLFRDTLDVGGILLLFKALKA